MSAWPATVTSATGSGTRPTETLDRGNRGLHGRVELVGTNRLEQAPLHAQRGEPHALFFAEAPAGDEHDRDFDVDGAHALGHFPAVHPGHADVRHHDVVAAGTIDLERR